MTSFAEIAALAENPLTYAEGRRFAAILGASPSKGARSPTLWNAAFKAHGVDAEMLPIDIASDRLEHLLCALDADPNFLGGAVAVPHKEAVAQWLKERLTPEAQTIGAVNCLFRHAAGRLMGTNTDGEGAVTSFEARLGKIAGKTVLLLGPGGAGKAVAAFVRRAVGPQGRLVIAGRAETSRLYAERMKCEWVRWQAVGDVLPKTDVVINCTSVGSGASAGQTPLSREQLSSLPNHAAVFDIIYQPAPSALLTIASQRGLKTLDGTGMNLEQAVLAYGHAAPQPKGFETTRMAMEQAKRAAT